jgi:hypothetical protein
MDNLSEILNSVHFSGSLWCCTEARAPWGLSIDAMELAQFHYIHKGSCWLKLADDQKTIALDSGDLIILPHGSAHSLHDDPATKPLNLRSILDKSVEDGRPLIIGKNGFRTDLICGYFKFDSSDVHPLFSSLPIVIHIKNEEGMAAPWLETTLQYLSIESFSDNLGTQAVINRLADI